MVFISVALYNVTRITCRRVLRGLVPSLVQLATVKLSVKKELFHINAGCLDIYISIVLSALF